MHVLLNIPKVVPEYEKKIETGITEELSQFEGRSAYSSPFSGCKKFSYGGRRYTILRKVFPIGKPYRAICPIIRSNGSQWGEWCPLLIADKNENIFVYNTEDGGFYAHGHIDPLFGDCEVFQINPNTMQISPV